MKYIYQFEINKPIETEEPVIELNDKGEEQKVLKKIKKDNFLKYGIIKPSIFINQEAELFYEAVVSDCIKKGIMSQLQMRKRFLNDGGVLSDSQKNEFKELWEQLFEKRAEYAKLNEKEDENKDSLLKLTEEITAIMVKLQEFEEKNGESLYDHTAENIAKNRTSLWFMLNLSYQEINGKHIPVFQGEKYEDKIKKYQEIGGDENDLFNFDLCQKLLLITSLWYFRNFTKKEDFDEIIKVREASDKK